MNVPNLPPHFLPRLGDLKALKDAVLAGLTKPAALTSAGKIGVQGMGGIGKTVLAAALARDSEVRHAFPDGIYWLTIGQKPNLLDLQNQLLRQLTGSKETLTTEQEAKDGLREALEGRPTLLVVDDAWTIDDTDAFSVTAPPARLLITTRNNEVLVGLGAEEHRVDVLSPSDALKMLAEWVGEKSPDKLPPEAAEVAKECGYLPLALAMIGAMIRLRPTAWKDALGRLHRADLEAVKRNFPGYPYPDLLRAIEVSVEGLESADRERHLDLAVFPEDQPIPEEALHPLWTLDEVDTRDCMTRLVARSLATRATDGASLILHDLQRDLIHKRREKDLPSVHLRLLKAWDALPKLSSYAWRWIAYHLVLAGRKDDLRRLLLKFKYLQAKLSATDPYALIADYDWLVDDEGLRLIQSALRLSAHILARNPCQLANQLIGRLADSGRPEIQDFLQQVSEKAPCPWLRPLNSSLIAPGGSLIRTLEGHTGSVSAVAVTPDGRRAVSASRDRTLRLWDLESGQTLRTLEGHTNWVSAVAVTPNGRRAVSASGDRTLRLWDLESGETLRTFEGHTDSVEDVAVAPDGRRAVSTSADQTLRLWDLESGQTLRTFEGHTDSVNAVAITPDGQRAVSASYDGTLRLWDLESGQALRTLEGHTEPVTAVAVTPDGHLAVWASGHALLWPEGKPSLRLWDLESGQTLRTLEGHMDRVSAVAVTPDGHRAVSTSADQTLRLWDLESGQTLRVFEGHTHWVNAVAITPNGRRAVSASEDGTLRLWDLGNDQTPRTFEGHTDSVNAMAVTPDGRRAVAASSDGTLRLWDLESGQTLRVLEGYTDGVQAMAVTPDGRRGVAASSDGTLRLWDLESGQTLRTLEGHTREASAVAATPESLFKVDKDRVSALAMTPDGLRAVLGSPDGTLRLWDLESGQRLRTLEGHTREVSAVAVTPDGRRAVSASEDQTLRLWDLGSGQTLRTLEGHTNWVSAVVVTLDGHRAVSASYDETLRLWDLESGQTLRTLEGHTNWVSAVAVTPNGHRAVSTSGDQTLRLWDLESGEEITTFTGDDCMISCAFAPDGQTIIAGGRSGRVHLLRLIEADKTKPAIGDTKIQLLHRQGQARSATDS